MTTAPRTPHVQIALPRSWSTDRTPGHGLLAAARSRTVPPSGFAPELSLRHALVGTADPITATPDLEVEDSDDYDLDGVPVSYVRLGHRLGSHDVVSERWSWLVGDVVVTLTGTVARVDYPDYADLFEDVAATVVVAEPTAA